MPLHLRDNLATECGSDQSLPQCSLGKQFTELLLCCLPCFPTCGSPQLWVCLQLHGLRPRSNRTAATAGVAAAVQSVIGYPQAPSLNRRKLIPVSIKGGGKDQVAVLKAVLTLCFPVLPGLQIISPCTPCAVVAISRSCTVAVIN